MGFGPGMERVKVWGKGAWMGGSFLSPYLKQNNNNNDDASLGCRQLAENCVPCWWPVDRKV